MQAIFPILAVLGTFTLILIIPALFSQRKPIEETHLLDKDEQDDYDEMFIVPMSREPKIMEVI